MGIPSSGPCAIYVALVRGHSSQAARSQPHFSAAHHRVWPMNSQPIGIAFGRSRDRKLSGLCRAFRRKTLRARARTTSRGFPTGPRSRRLTRQSPRGPRAAGHSNPAARSTHLSPKRADQPSCAWRWEAKAIRKGSARSSTAWGAARPRGNLDPRKRKQLPAEAQNVLGMAACCATRSPTSEEPTTAHLANLARRRALVAGEPCSAQSRLSRYEDAGAAKRPTTWSRSRAWRSRRRYQCQP